ncbi:AEC family transporter [Marinicrinis lubricantis]|uniref:AEC family transporter n=1 Tax=Marinicrinis lubricantis TaxID=2086470 RepID=A0ABW1IQW4_9BACL
MAYFGYILLHNIVPLSIMIGAGILMQKCFQLDMKTLSKLNFYLFSPVVIFKMLYESVISVDVIFQVLLFFIVFFTMLVAATEIMIRLKGYKGGLRVAVRHSVLFYNSANYTLPLNQLVFNNNPFTLSVQIIIMMIQTLLPHTYGVYSINSHRQDWRKTLRTVLTMPVIYAIPIAFLIKGMEWELPSALYTPIDYIAGGFIAVALITLGAQLGTMSWKFQISDVLLSNLLRLMVSPLLGAAACWMLGIDGLLGSALILSCAVPTALNSVLLAVEFDNEPEFASQAVLSSTVFSTLSVTVVIFFLQ